jgi:hypothetical protein
MTADAANGLTYTATGYQFYRGDLSGAQQALNSGNLSLGEYYTDFTGNTLTVGLYGQAKAGYQYYNGQITEDQFSEVVGGTAITQYLTARSMPQYRADRTPLPSATRSAGELRILNQDFVPNGSRLLQNLTNKVNKDLANNLPSAKTVLSDPELIAAGGNRGVARMQYGNAVERLVAREIRNDPLLRTLFEHTRGPGPDFRGIGQLQGETFDITTSGQIGAHLARPYGQGLKVITYQRPFGF